VPDLARAARGHEGAAEDPVLAELVKEQGDENRCRAPMTGGTSLIA
jgi:hypothetical protein